jgi:hypothetical protein
MLVRLSHPVNNKLTDSPVHLYWTSYDGKGCADEDMRLMAATVINIATDIVVVVMPIPIITKLQVPLREKITLGVLMCMGVLYIPHSPLSSN